MVAAPTEFPQDARYPERRDKKPELTRLHGRVFRVQRPHRYCSGDVLLAVEGRTAGCFKQLLSIFASDAEGRYRGSQAGGRHAERCAERGPDGC